MDKTARLKLIIVGILIQFPFFAVALISSFDANDFTKLIPIPNSQFDIIFFF